MRLLRKRIPCFVGVCGAAGLCRFYFSVVNSSSNLRLSSLFIYFFSVSVFILILLDIFLVYNHSTLAAFGFALCV